MKKIALIFGIYNHPTQPYITNWSNNVEKITDISFKQFTMNHVNISFIEKLGENSRRKKIKNYLSFLINSGDKYLFWNKKFSNVSTRRKLSIFSQYENLLLFQPDILHIINSYSYPKFDSWWKLTGTKMVVSFRGHDIVVRPFIDPKWMNYLQIIFQKVDCLHFVSHYLMDEAIKLGAPVEKCKVIYPGIDTEFFMQYSDNSHKLNKQIINLVSVGRLTWQKGLPNLLYSIKILESKGYRITYRVIGSGSEFEHLLFLSKELNIQNSVQFLRELPSKEILNVFSLSDIFIQPSLSESFGVSILEAMSFGLPVISTTVGGIPEIIQNGETGLLISPGNPEELADSIILLINDSILKKNIITKSQNLIKNKFSLTTETKNWEELYKGL